ncbi:MAG TPA: thiamine pyrophosphate-binding protein [Solirubrobacteraceae bacterium]|nr:thiamine pyrophosphate-binding protein [Solirubrobacteraceae bacterium]
MITVADVVGATVAAQGVLDAFGVIGSGNLVATNALTAGGARFHPARHEGGAVSMADGYARVSGRVGVLSVHQGPGLTNTMTGLAEAAKSRTPMLVLAGETPAAALTSNFRIDQHDLVESVGAIADRVFSPATAADDAQRAYQRALVERRPVVLMMPVDIQPLPAGTDTTPTRPPIPELVAPAPAPEAIEAAANLLAGSERPAIIAGRGAVIADAGDELEALGALIGAVLATAAPAHGLFAGLPYALGISGGFASPLAAELLPSADVVLIVGASANHWTTKHGAMIGAEAKVIQVDVDPRAIGRNRPADVAVLGDASRAAAALTAQLITRGHRHQGFRTRERADEIASRRWRDEPYEDAGTDEWIDPRTLSIALDRLLPANRQIAVDSGHFLGYPSMYLEVPDARSWVFANGFQAVGLGLGSAIGAAIAHPDRTTVAAVGDGGAFMALAELETAARLKLDNLLVLIYDDAAYGAEVHHFASMGHDVGLVRFPDADLAAIAHAAGAHGATVRTTGELEHAVTDWLDEPHFRPLVIDAKVNPAICAEWLEEAFRAG